MLVHPRTPTPAGFDPFLRHTEGAEVATDDEGITRALAAVRGCEVVVACDAAGFVGTGVVADHLAIEIHGACRLRVGHEVAVSDHRGLRYVGYRAVVGAVYQSNGKDMIRLFTPRSAVFYPGRRHVRLDGALGAHILVEVDDALVPARGIDISMGGLGLVIPHEAGFVVGQSFLVHIRFADCTLTLPAQVRSASVNTRGVRLGVEFAGHNPELYDKIRSALT